MLSSLLLGWFTNSQGMADLLTQNWLLGTLVVASVVFCETGLVVMPFLPGDSLLLTTGALLGLTGVSPYAPLMIIGLAAILGDAANYSIGRSRLGHALLSRGWVKQDHVEMARAYFERFGGLTITVGRFIPVVRTVAPFLAGLSDMEPRQFLMFNVLGGVIWCGSVILAGYWLGQVPWIQDNLGWLSVGVVFVALLTLLAQAWRSLKTEQA
jgi:membrane-associated protein